MKNPDNQKESISQQSLFLLLAELGLSKPEIRVYSTLLNLGQSKTGKISELSKVATSKIYSVLDSLIKKGLVSVAIRNNTKVFMPSPPEIIETMFEEQRKRREENEQELVKMLHNPLPKEKETIKYKYYEGVMGIKSLWLELSNELGKIDKNKIIKVHAGRIGSYEPLVTSFDDFNKKRLLTGNPYRLILPKGAEKTLIEKRKRQNAEIRTKELSNDSEWGVLGELFFITTCPSKLPTAYLMRDRQIAETFEKMFDVIWETAQPQ